MAKIFRSNQSQAVRIPKVAEFPPDVTEVDVVIRGNTRVLVPKRPQKDWEAYFRSRRGFSADFPEDIPDMPPRPVESFE